MTTLERLEQYASDHGIRISKNPIPGMRAAALRSRGRAVIAMEDSPEDPDAVRATVIAHELGHFDTGSICPVGVRKEPPGKSEQRAWKWAIENCVPRDTLDLLLCRYDGRIWEVAEELGVTEGLVRRAIEHYGL